MMGAQNQNHIATFDIIYCGTDAEIDFCFGDAHFNRFH